MPDMAAVRRGQRCGFAYRLDGFTHKLLDKQQGSVEEGELPPLIRITCTLNFNACVFYL